MKIFQSQRGFTLLEIIIAIGLVSALSLAVVSMLNMGNKGAKKISQDIEIASLVSEALGSLRDQKSCQATLNGMDFTAASSATAAGGATLAAIVKKTTTTSISILAEGRSYAVGTIGSLIVPLGGIKVYGYNSATIPAVANVEITFQRTGVTGVSPLTRRTIRIFLSDLVPTGGVFDQATDKCNAGESNFYCTEVGGTADLATGVCKSLNLYEDSPDNTPVGSTSILQRALTVNGDLAVLPDGSDLAELYVDGITTTTGDTITGGNFVLGAGNMLNLSAVGNMEIVAGTTSGSGANIELQTVNAFIDADATTFRNKAGALGTTVNVNGNLVVTGDSTIGGSQTIAVNQTISGNQNITGNNTVSGTETVTGTVSFTNNIVKTDAAGFLLLDKSAADLGVAESDITRVVNKDWVYKMLSSSMANLLTPAQKEAIVSNILATSTANSYITLRDTITDNTLGKINLAGTPVCAANKSITAVAYNSSNGTFTFTCGAPTSDCSVAGKCNNVYANTMMEANRFCVKLTATTNYCLTSGSRAFWGACNFASVLGTAKTTQSPTGDYWTCPLNYFMIGSRNTTGSYGLNKPAEPYCCPAQLVK